MTEKSIMWTTGSTGDGASEYTMAELIRWMRQTYIADNTDEGVNNNLGGELAVTGTASPLAIASGSALVYGFPYWNTAATTIAVPTPSGDTRIDRIVLEANWTAQTVRLTRVAGAEGGAAPALTQTDTVTWQISLAQASITVGGVITVTDEREFLHPNVEIEAGQFNADVAGDGLSLSSGVLTVNVDDTTIETNADTLRVKAAGLDNSHIANRARWMLISATECYNVTDTAWQNCDWRGWEMVDNKLCEVYGHFQLPTGMGTPTVYAVVSPAAAGNLRAQVEAEYGSDGEQYDTHAADSGYITVGALVQDDIEVPAAFVTLTGISADDYVNLVFRRDAVHAADTIAATVYFLGFRVYTTSADM
jgi:hypothetical protein